jgi:hypothetical protein
MKDYAMIKITTNFTSINEGSRDEMFTHVKGSEYDSYYIFRDNEGKSKLNTSSNPTRIEWDDITTRIAFLHEIYGRPQRRVHIGEYTNDQYLILKFTI